MGLSFFSVSETIFAWDGKEYSVQSLDVVSPDLQEASYLTTRVWRYLGQVISKNVTRKRLMLNLQKKREKEVPARQEDRSKYGQGRTSLFFENFLTEMEVLNAQVCMEMLTIVYGRGSQGHVLIK
jgi:hypothetical protein